MNIVGSARFEPPASSARPPRAATVLRRAAAAAALTPALLAAMSCARVEPAQKPAPPTVEVAPVVREDVPITREWIGTLDGYVNAEIRPQVEGYLLRRVYREGSFVAKGTLLFEIDPRQFQAALDQAKGDLARNEAALAKAKLDVERFTPLAAEKAISQEELDTAQSALRQARPTSSRRGPPSSERGSTWAGRGSSRRSTGSPGSPRPRSATSSAARR